MNYIYIYSGDLPEYALTSINSVLSVDNEANVILCTETKYNFENVNCISQNDSMRFQRFNNYADPIGWSSYREGCYQYESPNYFGVNSGWLFASASLKLPLQLIGLKAVKLKLAWMYLSLFVGAVLMIFATVELIIRQIITLGGEHRHLRDIPMLDSESAQ